MAKLYDPNNTVKAPSVSYQVPVVNNSDAGMARVSETPTYANPPKENTTGTFTGGGGAAGVSNVVNTQNRDAALQAEEDRLAQSNQAANMGLVATQHGGGGGGGGGGNIGTISHQVEPQPYQDAGSASDDILNMIMDQLGGYEDEQARIQAEMDQRLAGNLRAMGGQLGASGFGQSGAGVALSGDIARQNELARQKALQDAEQQFYNQLLEGHGAMLGERGMLKEEDYYDMLKAVIEGQLGPSAEDEEADKQHQRAGEGGPPPDATQSDLDAFIHQTFGVDPNTDRLLAGATRQFPGAKGWLDQQGATGKGGVLEPIPADSPPPGAVPVENTFEPHGYETWYLDGVYYSVPSRR